MTKNYYTSSNYANNHNTYGGAIYASDFETGYGGNGHNIAARIAADWKFDEQCKREAKLRDKNKNFTRKDS